ncbi:hypothetical protein BRARA_F03558 [Brassica rapa]|uniref:Transmembrane protein n=1 Tax=Brassica campestris TaxID=3711 RepID=A0A397ZAJ9_BRACM|nr:hypothetical protein BRARA_F03558 [Brassica rapa]
MGSCMCFPVRFRRNDSCFLWRWRRRREMTTRVCLVVEVLTRVPRRVWVFRCSLGGLSSLGLGFILFLCLLVFSVGLSLVQWAFCLGLLFGLCPLIILSQMAKKSVVRCLQTQTFA